jgi:hypothetical protein
MKVKDLIKELLELDGDCEVYVEADHGQTPEPAHYINEYYDQNPEEYYGEELLPIDLPILRDEYGYTEEEIDDIKRCDRVVVIS